MDVKTEAKCLFKVHLKVDATLASESIDAKFSINTM